MITTIDLDDTGWLLDEETGRPVPEHRLSSYFAEYLAPPTWATDIVVYVHGWQTSPESARRAAARLLDLAESQLRAARGLYPRLGQSPRSFAPWTVVVRWPSSSLVTLGGYRKIRDRAHAMGAEGHAAHIIGRLLGYLDAERPDPGSAAVLANRDGQYLHLVGHSFGCRFLCEAVQWAGDAALNNDGTLGWSLPAVPGRPFTADSMLLFQMAAPRDAFTTLFTSLADAPIHGPVVATHSRHDRATGFWHLRAERSTGIGHSGIGVAPAPLFNGRLLSSHRRYPRQTLDHRFVNLDASAHFTRGRRLNPAGAHSDHLRPESAHLLLSLADHSR
ncbi:hypothetical protein ACFTWS_34435 [Streptomyces sp. NPDC057027]|uniref:hypothetical protein n=1 Tax=Streptomyces sp. NPDC057027 TaxID=3346004 RepID=UPI003632E0D7